MLFVTVRTYLARSHLWSVHVLLRWCVNLLPSTMYVGQIAEMLQAKSEYFENSHRRDAGAHERTGRRLNNAA
jgi:hypothetical protein